MPMNIGISRPKYTAFVMYQVAYLSFTFFGGMPIFIGMTGKSLVTNTAISNFYLLPPKFLFALQRNSSLTNNGKLLIKR